MQIFFNNIFKIKKICLYSRAISVIGVLDLIINITITKGKFGSLFKDWINKELKRLKLKKLKISKIILIKLKILFVEENLLNYY